MGDTNVILKYRRASDNKICPECDAENPVTATSCSVCGYPNMASAPTIKAWSPADEMEPAVKSVPYASPHGSPTSSAGTPGGVPGGPSYPTYGPPSMPDKSAESGNNTVFWIVVAIILFIIVACVYSD